MKLLMQKHGAAPEAPPTYNNDSGMAPAPVQMANIPPTQPPSAPPAPVTLPIPAQVQTPPPAAPTANVSSVSAPAAPAIPVGERPAPTTQPMAVSPQYDDNARQQLYARLAEKRRENGLWAAAAGLGDTARRAAGGTGTNAAEMILAKGNTDEATATQQFEAGKKGQLEDVKSTVDLKSAGRKETEYQDENDPNSPMSKLAVGFLDKMSGGKAAGMGVIPGKTTYADSIKIMPMVEKYVTAEIARGTKNVTLGTKQQQDDENRLAKLGEALSTEKMRSGSVGQMSQSLAGIGKLKALMTGYKGDLTPQEWQEAAIAWNRILTQGGVGGGEHSIQALVPHTLRGNIMGQIQWLTNNPTGTAQQEFSKRLQLGMDREEKYATQYVNKYKVGRLMDFQDVAGRKPTEVRTKLESQGLGFEDVSAVHPDLAAKLWPKGSNSAGAAPASSGDWSVVR